MFPVGRYDPTKQAADKPKKKKRKSPGKNKTEQLNESSKATKTKSGASSLSKDSASRKQVKPETPKKSRIKVIAEEQKDEDPILDSLDGRMDRFIQIEMEDDTQEQPNDEVATALELAKRPIRELAIAWKLRPFLVENVKGQGLDYFFPIQNLTIPAIIATSPYVKSPDLMITAPTGSGKTLSYAIPMLQVIPSNGPRVLRTIVILPSRDLALQVESVMKLYAHGSNIRIGLAIASTDFVKEHASLTDDPSDDRPSQLRRRLERDPGNLTLAMKLLDDPLPFPEPLVVTSPIDILICTPGRLMDHLDAGLSLQYLRHLVVDEADRLLASGYQNWLDRVLQLAPHPRTLLVSATATTDPRRIARFTNIKHLSIVPRILSMPPSLAEYTVESTAAQKPLVLVSLLMEKTSSVTMVFCSSLEATHRLARLLQLLWVALGFKEGHIGEMSSKIRGPDRHALLQRCRDASDELSVLVCSDGMARGMDLEQIETIVHYDFPTSPKTYVHRCGRTARAGRSGKAITLLKQGQADAFFKMRSLIEDSGNVGPLPIRKDLVQNALVVYSKCMRSLQTVLQTEEGGSLQHGDSISGFIESE